MSILTNDEVIEVYFREKWDFETSLDYERAIESAVLEKLAGMELPQHYALIGKEERVVTETFVMEGAHYEKVYTEAQLHQAYAQGAASVLSAEPSGFISPHDLKMLKEGYPATVVMLLGAKRTQPLYTLKTIE